MFKKINRLWNKFKLKFIKTNLTKNFRMIFLGRITINSATQLMGLFLPIFLYQFFDLNLRSVIIFYLITDVLYLNLISLGCRMTINKLGIKKSLQISIIFGAIYYSLFIIINNPGMGGSWASLKEINPWLLLTPIIFFNVLFRLSHWVPFHTNIAKLTEKNIRVKQLSFMEVVIMALGAIMPIIAGFILDHLGYSALFLLAVLVYLVSLIPFSLLPEVRERFVWTWKKTWENFFSKKMRLNILAHVGDGAESVAGSIIWPIFIWQLLKGDYFQIGALSSLIIIFTILLQIIFGNILNKSKNRRKFLKIGSLLYSFGWILKSLINSAFYIFIFSTYHNISQVFSKTSFSSMHYDIAADQGHYVDEYTVLKEMAVLFGKILMGVIIIIILPHLSLRYIFLLAALSSLSISLLKQDQIPYLKKA